jgi:hypothetical protein
MKSLSSLKRAVDCRLWCARTLDHSLISEIGCSVIVSGLTSLPPIDTDWNVMSQGILVSFWCKEYANDFVHCVCHPYAY